VLSLGRSVSQSVRQSGRQLVVQPEKQLLSQAVRQAGRQSVVQPEKQLLSRSVGRATLVECSIQLVLHMQLLVTAEYEAS
jgi:hypothetical protein